MKRNTYSVSQTYETDPKTHLREKDRQIGETGYKFRFTSLRHGLCNPFGKTKFWFLFDVQVFGLSDKTSMQIRSMQIRSGNLNEISDSILFLRRGQHVHACHQSYSRLLFFAHCCRNWKWNLEERNGVWVCGCNFEEIMMQGLFTTNI